MLFLFLFSLLEAIRRQNDWHNLLIRFLSNTKCQQKSVTKPYMSYLNKNNITRHSDKCGKEKGG